MLHLTSHRKKEREDKLLGRGGGGERGPKKTPGPGERIPLPSKF